MSEEREQKIAVLEAQVQLLREEEAYEDAKQPYQQARDEAVRAAMKQALDNGLELREVKRAGALAAADFDAKGGPLVDQYQEARDKMTATRRDWREEFRPRIERKPGDARVDVDPIEARGRVEG